MNDDILRRLTGDCIKPGDELAAWVNCGLFHLDPPDGGVYFQMEDKLWERAEVRAALDDLAGFATAEPFEGDRFSLWGETHRWRPDRQQSRFHGCGQFTIVPQISGLLLSTLVTAQAPLRSAWHLELMGRARAMIWLDGRRVDQYDQAADDGPLRTDSFRVEMDVGVHRLNVALIACGAIRKLACRFELAELSAESLRTVMPFKGDVELRVQAERAAIMTRLQDRRVPLGGEVRLAAPDINEPAHGLKHDFEVDGKPAREVRQVDGIAHVRLGDDYARRADVSRVWKTSAGEYVTRRDFIVSMAPDSNPREAPADWESRRRELLEFSLTVGEREGPWNTAIWDAVAWAALKDEAPPAAWIQEALNWLVERRDCADFTLHGILRLLFLDDQRQFLSEKLRLAIREVLLGFCYAEDEVRQLTMFMGSENHRFLFHSGGWLAGLRYPDDVFRAGGLTGRALAAKSRVLTLEWLRQRGLYGFNEWHSAAYLSVNLYALLNLCDYARVPPWRDKYIGMMADGVTNLIFYFAAADTYEGAMIGCQGRAYAEPLLMPEMESLAPLCRLAYGIGALASIGGRPAAIHLATSNYRPPAFFAALACDPRPRDVHYRQGIFVDGASAHYSLRRTGDYGVGVYTGRRSGRDAGVVYVRALLSNAVSVFGSCSMIETVSNAFRPDYWSGNEAGMEAVRRAGTVLIRWFDQPRHSITHFHFPIRRFDETAREGDWIIGRAGTGWVALGCSEPFQLAEYGDFAGEELICRVPGAGWVMECGGESEGNSFSAARSRLRATGMPDVTKKTAQYNSPFAGEMKLEAKEPAWDAAFAAGAELHGKFGNGERHIQYNDNHLAMWLD